MAINGYQERLMGEAVIVSAARTGIGKAFRGALNNTHGATMGAHVVAEAIKRARLDPGEIEDVIIGAAWPEGASGQQYWPAGGSASGSAGQRTGHDRGSSMLIWADVDCHRCQSHPVRRNRPFKSLAAWSPSRWCRTVATGIALKRIG